MTGHNCSFPWLAAAHQAALWAPHCCSQCREMQLSRTNPAPPSPELLWHTTGLQLKGAWPSCQRQDPAAAPACRALAELCLQMLAAGGTSRSDTLEIIRKPVGFPFPFQRGPKTGILLKLQDTQAGLRSYEGGMLQTLPALPAPLLPAPLTAPQSSCREAKLEEGGTSTEAVQFLAKELQAQASNM